MQTKLNFVMWGIIHLPLVVGCGGSDGPPLYPISGVVTFNGEPLLEGDMVVRTVDGRHAAGSRIRDGKFLVKTVKGPSIVEITALRDVEGAEFQELNPGERVPVREQFIPVKYNAESTLRMDVERSADQVNFELMPDEKAN